MGFNGTLTSGTNTISSVNKVFHSVPESFDHTQTRYTITFGEFLKKKNIQKDNMRLKTKHSGTAIYREGIVN